MRSQALITAHTVAENMHLSKSPPQALKQLRTSLGDFTEA